MSYFKNIRGQVFGKLTILKVSEKRTNDNKILWECQCSCSNIILKTHYSLHRSPNNSCELPSHPTKICTKCKCEKLKTEYHKAGKCINPACKQCMREFYLKNRDKIIEDYNKTAKNEDKKLRRKQISKKSRNKHREKAILYKLEYNKRPNVIERRKQIHATRKATDPNYSIKRRLRGRVRDIIRHYFANDKKYKYNSSLVLLGCDMEFFKRYIESKFTDGMCWERISEIHIDHIKPCSQFLLNDHEQQRLCFCWKNLQPLWWRDNLSKGDSYSLG